MSHDPPIGRVHTHVWWLGEDTFFRIERPGWGWVALGPRGFHAGAERTADEAKRRAQAAAYLVNTPEASKGDSTQ